MDKAPPNPTPCCSAIPTSKVRSGKTLPNLLMPVPSGIAAVIPIIFSSILASSISVSANTLVYAGGDFLPFLNSPVAMSNGFAPCHTSAFSSAISYPLPLRVIT